MRGKQSEAAARKRALAESGVVAELRSELEKVRAERDAVIADFRQQVEADSARVIRAAREAMQAELDGLRHEARAQQERAGAVTRKVAQAVSEAYLRQGADSPEFTPEEYELLIQHLGGTFGSMCETLGLDAGANRSARRARAQSSGALLKRMRREG